MIGGSQPSQPLCLVNASGIGGDFLRIHGGGCGDAQYPAAKAEEFGTFFVVRVVVVLSGLGDKAGGTSADGPQQFQHFGLNFLLLR